MNRFQKCPWLASMRVRADLEAHRKLCRPSYETVSIAITFALSFANIDLDECRKNNPVPRRRHGCHGLTARPIGYFAGSLQFLYLFSRVMNVRVHQ
jgi:hypothetical protein